MSAGLNDKSADWFRESLKNAKTSRDRMYAVRNLSHALHELGNTTESHSVIQFELEQENDPKIRVELYTAAAALFEKEKNYKHQALALEKVTEYRPNDLSLRFKIAYAYSNSGLEDLALFHYDTYLGFSSEDSTVLNNLAVAYQSLELPISAVNYYQMASKAGNTLAKANLAYRLINAGFVDSAREILKGAQAESTVHANVNEALVDLETKQEKENETKKSLLVKASRRQVFLRSYAEALFRTRTAIPTKWKRLNGTLVEVTVDGNSFKAQWEEGRRSYTLSATFNNSGAEIKIEDKNTAPPLSGLRSLRTLLGASASEGYMYADHTGDLHIMETGKQDKFWTLTPLQ